MVTTRQRPTRRLDWFTPAIVACFVLGLLLPVGGRSADGVEWFSTAAIALLFFGYGARLRPAELAAAGRARRTQLSMVVATFVLFPLVGWVVSVAAEPLLGPFATGVLYLSLLPSTVQSSVVMTSLARGDVAASVTGAALSNLVGVAVTPLLVTLLMHQSGAAGGSGWDVVWQILVPFVAGHVAGRWIGDAVRRANAAVKVLERGTICLVVYLAASHAGTDGSLDGLGVGEIAALVAACAVVLAVMLVTTWYGSSGLPTAERISVMMVGSKKSLATGLPMATALLGTGAAAVALPVIIFHQLQLITCAMLARRLGARPGGEPAPAGDPSPAGVDPTPAV